MRRNRQFIKARVWIALAITLPTLAACSLLPLPLPLAEETPSPTPSVTPTTSPPQATAEEGTIAALEASATAAQGTIAALEATASAAAEEAPTATELPPTATTAPNQAAPAPVSYNTPVPTTPPSPTPTPTPEILHIQSFEVSPTVLDPGGAVTVSWQTTGDEVDIHRIDDLGRIVQYWEALPSGSLTFDATDDIRNFMIFRITVTTEGRQEVLEKTVTMTCPDAWFFSNPPPACPRRAALTAPGVAQHFERGLMVWMDTSDQIFIFYNDGGSFQGQAMHAYDISPDRWWPWMPENDPGIEPPYGYYQPIRGFYMAWAEPDYVTFHARERLGWATDQEFPLTVSYQCDSSPSAPDCYLQGPNGVILMKPEFAAWSLWNGPGQ
jgi:hypothetical protein